MMAGADPLVGATVGRYRLTRLLGKGGMGRVYEAIQPDVGSRVAVKVIAEEHAADPELTERFFAEARAVNFIRHENIINVLDLVRLPDGRPVIVMELIEGKTLRELVHGGHAPLGSVVHVMIDVLAALAAAHAAGVIHRDLKPDNILVTPSGRAKVLDFGIAKLARPGSGGVPRTRTGAVLGTPEYMAPEQITGAAVDARTDIYAAGVMLFEAVTGRRPFDGASDFEVMRAHVDDPPPAARSLRASIPAELESVIGAALAKRPHDRFTNATAMAAALHAASAVLPASEWRALEPGGRAFVRPAAPPVAPAQHASLVGFVAEQSGSLPTRAEPVRRSEPPGRLETPTVNATPRRRELPVPAPRSWRIPILGAVGIAVTSIVIALAVRRGAEGPRSGASAVAAGSAVVAGTAPAAGPAIADAAIAPADAPPDRGVRGFRESITFNARAFDPIAFYPEALALARRLMPDAQLVMFDAGPLSKAGTFDLAYSKPLATGYVFRSPKDLDAVVDNKLPIGRYCNVLVTLTPPHVDVYSSPAQDCTLPLTSPPRCMLADMLDRTQLRPGMNISFKSDNRGRPSWIVDNKRRHDDCPASSPAPAPGPTTTATLPVQPQPAPPRRASTFTSGSSWKDLDKGSYEPLRYLATARELAKQLESDAELVSLQVGVVQPPGRFEFGSGPNNSVLYEFRSKSLSVVETMAEGAWCMVEVEVIRSGKVRIGRNKSDQCKRAFVRSPRCSLPAVWSRAVAKGMNESSHTATVTWDSRGWVVAGTVGEAYKTFVLPDDCR